MAQYPAADEIAFFPTLGDPYRLDYSKTFRVPPFRRHVAVQRVQDQPPLAPALFRQPFRHGGQGTLVVIIHMECVAIRPVGLLFAADILPTGVVLLVPFVRYDRTILHRIVQVLCVCNHRFGPGHLCHLIGSQVVQHITGKAQLQQLGPDGGILRRVSPGLPVHGIALAQKHRQQDRRQRHTQIPPQHRPGGQAHRSGRDHIAGIGQRAGQLHQIPQDNDIDNHKGQYRQPSLQPDIGQRDHHGVEDHQCTGGRRGRLLAAGGTGYAHHTPPQADIQGQCQQYRHIRRNISCFPW